VVRAFLAPKKNNLRRLPLFFFFFLHSATPLCLVLSTTFFSISFHFPTFTMGTGKKEATRKERQGKTGDGMANVKTKGENFYRYV
jgi:hypothetical protein